MTALLLGLVFMTACTGMGGNFAGYQDRYDSGRTPLYGVTPYDEGVNLTDMNHPEHPTVSCSAAGSCMDMNTRQASYEGGPGFPR